MKISKEIPILIADDDQDDVLMLKELFTKNDLVNPLYFVSDGVELLNFLNREGKFERAIDSPRPGIILLSLHMPKMNGITSLETINSNKYIKDIPIVVMTSSTTESDIVRSWEYAADGYLHKPIGLKDLIEVFRKLRTKGILIERVR